MREIVHIQAGQCGNQIGAKVSTYFINNTLNRVTLKHIKETVSWITTVMKVFYFTHTLQKVQEIRVAVSLSYGSFNFDSCAQNCIFSRNVPFRSFYD